MAPRSHVPGFFVRGARRGFVALLLFGVACGSELPEPTQKAQVVVAAVDGRPLDACSRAPQLEVRGLELEPAVAGLRLFGGAVSSYANGRLRRGEVIGALAGREVPLSVWSAGDVVVARPGALLAPGEEYSLAVLQRGVIASLVVAEEGAPVLSRLWPPHVHPRGSLIYCLATDRVDDGSDDALGDDEGALFDALDDVELPPFGIAAEWRPGVGDEGIARGECATLIPREDLPEGFVVPPQTSSGLLFDPAPIAVVAEDAPKAGAECGEDRAALAQGCAVFEGAELVVELDRPSAWFVSGASERGEENVSWWGIASPPSLTIPAFEPLREYDIVAYRFDERGRSVRGDVRLSAGEPRPRVVINEVLSDPLGPEPQGEWIELVNVGTAPAFLEGWVLEDGGGPTPLPAVELPVGAFGLIVARDYSASAGDDVVPLPTAVPLVVERVGHRGLTNGGEPLRLVDATGRVVSAVPALAARKAGVSIARRDPWSRDEVDGFGPHAAPGASPGGPNTVD